MRRGQVNQIFVFIMAIVVAGLVILFGVSFIKSYLEKQDEVMLADFVHQVERNVKGTSFGSVNIDSFRVPADYDVVCFVDYRADGPYVPIPYERVKSELAVRVEGGGVLGAEYNTDMFLIDTKGNNDDFDDEIFSAAVGKVVVSEAEGGYVCITSGGRLKLRFEGVKGGVEVSEDAGLQS